MPDLNYLLKIGDKVTSPATQASCTVDAFLGAGGQGEVYRATLEGTPVALKWYFVESATPEMRAGLAKLVRHSSPGAKFLWPLDLMESASRPYFGYVMPLRDARFKGLLDHAFRRVDTTQRVLSTLGLQLAENFFKLHAEGLAYADISWGNVFFDPQTGDALICDNDNVSGDGESHSKIQGTMKFMAPEIVRGEARPSAQTDLFSLSVLLFYVFLTHHPLEGKRDANIRCLDARSEKALYGTHALFIFDPQDASNAVPEPTGEPEDPYANPRICWPILPQFLRDMFIRAFTVGLHEPLSRIRETEWMFAMTRLRDSIVTCQSCTYESFYDEQVLVPGVRTLTCHQCGQAIRLPVRLRVGSHLLQLNDGAELFPHHLGRDFDFSKPVGVVVRSPNDPKVRGIRNLSQTPWVFTDPSGGTHPVEPGKVAPVAPKIKIAFGSVEGVQEI